MPLKGNRTPDSQGSQPPDLQGHVVARGYVDGPHVIGLELLRHELLELPVPVSIESSSNQTETNSNQVQIKIETKSNEVQIKLKQKSIKFKSN